MKRRILEMLRQQAYYAQLTGFINTVNRAENARFGIECQLLFGDSWAHQWKK